MSRLNASRIINLSYNKNTMRINDETFEFGGESTLMSLRNGGGKTVMVQMLLAPFVKRRDLKDRKFTDYFNSNLPTYILTEWILDNNSGYVLIGMAVRKKPLTLDEEYKNELDIITFIHEYKSGNDYDIHNIPVVEHSRNGLRIKPMAQVRKMFEELKNSRHLLFDFYDLSNDYQRRKYFDRLGEFSINQKEWERIIQKINMKESGLSELFNKAKTIASLVSEWFLPAIEDKLNDSTNKVEGFRQILGKYIFQLKENESKLHLKKGIEEFRDFSDRIFKSAEDLEIVQKNIGEVENSIANLYKYIKTHINMLEEEKQRLEGLEETINKELDEIEYERLSFDYYRLLGEIQRHEEEALIIQNKIDRLETQKNLLVKEFGCLECAGFYKDYTESSGRVLDLEYKLSNAQKDDEEKARQLDDVGYSINVIYTEKIAEDKRLLQSKEKEMESKQKELEGLEKLAEDKNGKITQLSVDIALLKERISGFERYEKSFKNRYGEFIVYRNILGEYDESSLKAYERKLSEREKIHRDDLTGLISRKETSAKQQEQKVEELQKVRLDRGQKANEIMTFKESLKSMEQKCDGIKRIMLYCNIDENRLFDKAYIVDIINGRLNTLNHDRDSLQSEADKLKHLQEMYESGKNIKLPGEFVKKLDELDIPVLYGLMWLKKQALPMEKKIKLIKNNPFLPYSIIMSVSSIELLKASSLDIFTSLPIPIVEQDKLDRALTVEVANKLYTIQNVSFYISFNEKLLDEEELKLILDDIKRKIVQNRDAVEIKIEEIRKFSIDLEDVNRFDVKKSDMDNIIDDISGLEREVEELGQKEVTLAAEIEGLKVLQRELEVGIEKLKGTVSSVEKEKQDYSGLLYQYEEYKLNDARKKVLDEDIKAAEEERDSSVQKAREGAKWLQTMREEAFQIRSLHAHNEEMLKEYLLYREGNILKKDLVDLEADYKSLKSGMGLAVQEYSRFLNGERSRFRQIEDSLIRTQGKYSLSEENYRNIIFDTVKMEAVQAKISDYEKRIKEEGKGKRKEEDALIRLNVNKENQLAKIKESLGREEPKAREHIFNLDFKGRRELKETELHECSKKIHQTLVDIKILNKNQDTLEQFKDIELASEQTLDIKYNQIANVRLELVSAHNASKSEESDKRTALGDCIAALSSNLSYRTEDYFKNTIDILLEIKHKPEEIKQTLLMVQDVHGRTMLQLQSDLARIEEEGNTIITTLLEYAEEIYKHMDTIDDNSSLNIGGRSYKMLNIEQPEWQQEMNLLKMKDYIDRVVKECKNYLSLGKSIDDVLGKEITTSKLYDHIIGINELDIKLYKIETSKVVRISWNEVAQNSGGEGFVSAFIIMVCLLSYMRREESILINTKEEGKVLIMDNPFAQTNAEHLLKPLIDIAKKYNTQLICFTGLGGDSIYNRFDNIYVLNLTDSKLHQGLQIMESEHKKGGELTQMASTRFLIRTEKAEQMTLF